VQYESAGPVNEVWGTGPDSAAEIGGSPIRISEQAIPQTAAPSAIQRHRRARQVVIGDWNGIITFREE
jgi:hypothetical protein